MYVSVENGIVLFLWIGLHVSPDWLQQVFGVATIGHVDIEMVRLSTIKMAVTTCWKILLSLLDHLFMLAVLFLLFEPEFAMLRLPGHRCK
jgi:hypothetical protein